METYDFFKCYHFIQKNINLDSEEKLIISVVLDFKEKGKKAQISVEEMSEILGISRSNLKRKKQHLQELELITIHNTKSDKDNYEVSVWEINEEFFNKFFNCEFFMKKQLTREEAQLEICRALIAKQREEYEASHPDLIEEDLKNF